MSLHPLDERLREAGIQRKRAEEDRLAAAHYLRGVVREAVYNRYSKTRIAEVAGISRQTVHQMLKDR